MIARALCAAPSAPQGHAIRPARLRDVPALARVLWSFTRTTDWLPQVRRPSVDLALMARLVWRGSVRLIRDEAGPCAFIAREGEVIHALYVHTRARRCGHGRSLLRDAKAHSATLALWTPLVDNSARRFYAAEGFSTAAFGDGSGNDEALPEVLMIWPPSPTRRQDTV